MIKNYIKIAWRNLLKKKEFSAINIAGLATGLACFILIAMYVFDELSYDRFHQKADRIYRVNADIKFGGNELKLVTTSDMMGNLLKKDYPEVEQYTRIYASNGAKMIRKDNSWIQEPNIANVDSTFFDVFSFPAIIGDTKTALNEPNTVVISKTAALKYFGSTDVLHKTIETDDDNSTVYKVTAVIEDMPQNSHFRYDMLFSMDNAKYNWGQLTSHNFHTYLLLRQGADARLFSKNLEQYIEKYVLPQVGQSMNIRSIEEFRKAGNQLDYFLMPLTDIHLKSDRYPELAPNGNIQYVYIFGAISVFILLIACVNFMNLSTARSAGRAKEVGIRKVLGTGKQSLIGQFLTESTLMAFISTLIATGIVYLTLPLFNSMAAKNLFFSNLFDIRLFSLLLALPLIVGMLAGYYPAFYLSRFKPISVLKSSSGGGSGKSNLRSGLVVFQFATSIFLIIGTMVVYRQLDYIQKQKLGYNKEQVLIIDNYYSLGTNTKAFKDEMLKQSGVVSGTVSGYLPVTPSNRSDNTYSKDAVSTSENSISMQTWKVDTEYIPTLGMEIKSGRNFSPAFQSDSNAVILNETAARVLGYDNPIGKKIYRDGTTSYEIIGVVKDFNYESLRQTIAPLGLFLARHPVSAAFKINTADIKPLLSSIENKWAEMAPGAPFNYRFMNESFDSMYRVEQRVGLICMCFSVMAILIACLGLFGLAAYMAEQRTREIGIRKVLGASVTNVVSLLSTDFIKLVAIGFIIAAPLSWWIMNSWLNDFAFRAPIGWWIFLAAGATALLIALLTVCTQALKAALTNPVKSLRTE